ncbi:MAG: rhodanese-like domain-containing protein [Flavobacteriaceae bacterium]|nr:rhodanese-like domain-containing protein [Flavobacteriaceae bacterium]
MGLASLLGLSSSKNKVKEFINKGALIVDVRTKGEYNSNHIGGSINIPLDTISNKAKELKQRQKPIILCCASGIRSKQATSILKSHDIECINGGSWTNII